MAQTVVNSQHHTDAVITALSGVGFSIGDHEAPDSPSPAFPYAVVYKLPGNEVDGPIEDGQADIEFSYQITCVGERRDQAEGLQAKIRDRFLNTPITVAGRAIYQPRLDVEGPVERDDDARTEAGTPLWYAIDLFAFWSTPS